MLNLAIKGNPNFEISDMEIERGGVSYTIDTLKDIRSSFIKAEDELFYLIGSDSLLGFKKWKNPKEILKYCNVVVAIRPGFRLAIYLPGYYIEFNLLIFLGLKFHRAIFDNDGEKIKR